MAESHLNETLMKNGLDPISRIRRNHGLEHATLHVLAERNPRRSMAGHSDLGGFWIIGDLKTEEVQSAASEALSRLRNGEHELAVHPNCGTNFATAGILAGGVAALSMFGAGKRLRDKLERIPFAMTLATMALILSQPLGLRIQRELTTSGIPGSLEIVSVERKDRGCMKLHRVSTRG
jgi:hypothetical protein